MGGFLSISNLVRQLDTRLRRFPDWLRGYLIALAALTLATLVAAALLHTVGPKATIVVSLLGDLVFLGCAWLGYGPGVMVCFLIVFVVPPLLVPGRPTNFDPGRFGLLIFISLLISRIGTSKRRSEAALREWGETLEARVRERTFELERSRQSLAWLAAIVESSDDAIIGESLDGTITSWNRGARALYGYAPGEVIGESFAILLPPERRGRIADILPHIGDDEEVRHLETACLRKDGAEVAVSLTVSPVRDSFGAVQGLSVIARDRTAERRAQQAVEASEHRYRLLFENNPQPMWVYDQATLAFLTVNDTAIDSYGYSRDEFLQMTLKDIRPPEDIPKLLDATAVRTTALRREGTWRHRKKNGQIISVEITEHPLLFEERQACLVMATDVTERRKLEERYRQAQRLESIGRLAGGVAHDFNNLLTVINGYAEMLLQEAAADDAAKEALVEIRGAGERAAALTHQLLAFSRQQVIQVSIININTVVSSTETFLRRLIGEDIELIAKLSPDLGQVEADPGQIQQIIMNLAVNSRDAMPNGGNLILETANVILDEGHDSEQRGLQPGPHVMLAVTDTGHGMSPEVRARIFEPFYTTKELGKGTGLGLATVYGMVKHCGGWIWVYSEPNRGTTFKIYLPRTDKSLSQLTPAIKAGVHGSETILIVDDQAEVRTLAVAGLTRFGYSVHGAGTGGQALTFCREFPGDIHLVITDVIMADMNGRELAGHIAQLRPKTRILFMSGYTTNVVVHQGVLVADVEYLQKPFTPDSLARKVREVLERAAGASSAS